MGQAQRNQDFRKITEKKNLHTLVDGNLVGKNIEEKKNRISKTNFQMEERAIFPYIWEKLGNQSNVPIISLFTSTSHTPYRSWNELLPNDFNHTSIAFEQLSQNLDINEGFLKAVYSTSEQFLGEYMDILREKNKTEENTIFLFVGDHGNLLKNSDTITQCCANRFHPTLFHVPFVLYGKNIPQMGEINAATTHNDILPIILNLMAHDNNNNNDNNNDNDNQTDDFLLEYMEGRNRLTGDVWGMLEGEEEEGGGGGGEKVKVMEKGDYMLHSTCVPNSCIYTHTKTMVVVTWKGEKLDMSDKTFDNFYNKVEVFEKKWETDFKDLKEIDQPITGELKLKVDFIINQQFNWLKSQIVL